jgi:hypothetical protein
MTQHDLETTLALDGAEVQSRVAIFIAHKFHMKTLANWLYRKAFSV